MLLFHFFMNCLVFWTYLILWVFTVLEICRLVKELFSSTFFQNTVKVISEEDILVETMALCFMFFFWLIVNLMVNFLKQHTLHCWKGKVKKCLHPSSPEEQEFTIFSNQSLLRVWRFACTTLAFSNQFLLNLYMLPELLRWISFWI